MSFKSELTIDVIDTHTEGEPTRIMFWNNIPRNLKDALSVRKYFIEHYDYIRKTLLLEPRGHKDQFGAILLPPVNPESDYTVIYPTTESYLDMCGHATIGVSMALVALGYVPFEGNEKTIIYDTVAGTVKARVKIENGEPVPAVKMVNNQNIFFLDIRAITTVNTTTDDTVTAKIINGLIPTLIMENIPVKPYSDDPAIDIALPLR